MISMSKGYKAILIISAVTLVIIWGHSMMPPSVSSDESGFVLKLLTPFLEIFTGKGNVTEHLVRKLGHFTEYTVFGAELGILSGCITALNSFLKRFGGAIITAFTAAFIDETIQIFSGRGPAITDVWIDIAGAVLGSVIALLIIYSASKRRRKL